jgi:8-oxo-dGTP pyrophosphatase MutT (NUDIX family)
MRIRNLILRLYILAQALFKPVAYAVAGAIVDDQGRVLLARHHYKMGWQLPIGGVERGEPAAHAVLREMKEEVGLSGGAAMLFAIYTRSGGLATNVLVLYRITGATVKFEPNLEIKEICFVDPASPPEDCTEDSRRRLQELAGIVPLSPYW